MAVQFSSVSERKLTVYQEVDEGMKEGIVRYVRLGAESVFWHGGHTCKSPHANGSSCLSPDAGLPQRAHQVHCSRPGEPSRETIPACPQIQAEAAWMDHMENIISDKFINIRPARKGNR